MNETIESPVVGTNRMSGQRRAASSTRRMLAALGVATLGCLSIGEAGAAAGALDEPALLERADLVFQGVVERVEYAFSDTRGGRTHACLTPSSPTASKTSCTAAVLVRRSRCDSSAAAASKRPSSSRESCRYSTSAIAT